MSIFTTAELLYFSPPEDGSRPYNGTVADPVTGEWPKNWKAVPHQIQIENLRGKEDTVSLDTTGFQFHRSPSKHTSFNNDEEIKAEYYPESIELIKELTGASRVVLFDHTIRRRRPGELDDGPDRRQPVAQVHVDQTRFSATARVHRHLPEADAADLVKGRFQIINLWRPIKHAAFDWPLAVADFRSVDMEKDLVPTALVYPPPIPEGETLGVKFNPAHRWVYLKGMEPDEVVLIKCFDSKDDGSVSILTPHTGFEDPSTPKDAPLRESIELRALVFYDN